MKWQPFFNFVIMANADIPFPSTLGKLETQTLGELIIWHFSVWSILMKWQPFFNLFIMTDTDIPFPLTLRKLETQTLGGLLIWNFSVQSILMKWQPFLGGLSLHLNHLIASRTGNYDWPFGTLPFGLFGWNLDTRDLETYPRTYSGHFQFLTIPGPFEYFSENGWSQKIKVFLMKERSLPPYRFSFRRRGP